MHEPLASLCAALAAQPLDLDAEAIADALWLAAMRGESRPRPPTPPLPPPPPPPPNPDATPEAQAGPANPPHPPAGPARATRQESKDDVGLAVPPPRADKPASVDLAGPIIGTPAGRALPNARHLSRALKSLNRPVPARTRSELDEAATIRRYSEDRLWLAALRPARARWLEVALVVDVSPSMALWKGAVREFLGLLERQGAFRDVRLWRLDTSGPAPRLLGRSGSAARSQKELIHPAGRRVVVLASDCLGAAWRGTELTAWLDQWGQAQPLAIAQLLPQRLWRATALNARPAVTLSSAEAGAPNQRLRWRSQRPSLAGARAGLPVPVFSLDSDLIRAWTRMVLGQSTATVEGYLWKRDAVPAATPQAAPASAVDLARRLAVFRAVASAEAVRLAELLSVVPLRLPVARLVQQVMLPQSSPAHLAEVFLSGLIRRITPANDPAAIDEVEFDFLAGGPKETDLRQQLLSGLPAAAARHAREAVSAYICERLGISEAEFAARIVPTQGRKPEHALAEEFARISAAVLDRLGPAFAAELKKWRPPAARPLSAEQEKRFKEWGARRGLAAAVLDAIAEDARSTDSAAIWDASSIAECCKTAVELFSHLEPGAAGRIHQDGGPVETSWGSAPAAALFQRDAKTRTAGKSVPPQMKAVGADDHGLALWDLHVSIRAAKESARWGFLSLQVALAEPYSMAFCRWVEDIAGSLGARFSELAAGASSSAHAGEEIPPGAHVFLRVAEIRGTLEFHLRCPETQLEISFQTPHRELEIRGVIADFRACSLSELPRRAVALGSRLAHLALPNALAFWLGKNHGRLGSLQLSDEATRIPWEIAYLGDRSSAADWAPFFLAELPLVRGNGNTPLAPTLTVREGRARFMTTDVRKEPALPGLQREKQWIEKQLGAEPLADVQDLAVLPPDGVDLLHLAGHGNAEGFRHSPERSIGRRDFLRLSRTPPLCVFNFDYSADLAPDVLSRGTVAFLGTNSEIDDISAADFAERFYQELIASRTLAEAAREARRTLRDEGSAEWLRYVVYGHPGARLEMVRKPNPFRGKKILWVDDHPQGVYHLEERLTGREAGITRARSTNEALRLLAKEKFDGVISDMARPEGTMAGLDLLDRLREDGRTMPVVIFCGPNSPPIPIQVRAHLGQIASRDFDAVFESLAAALLAPDSAAHHLPIESLISLRKFFAEHGIEEAELQASDIEPRNADTWARIWKRFNPADVPQQLLAIAQLAALDSRAQLYRCDAVGRVQHWPGMEPRPERERTPIPRPVELAAGRGDTVHFEAGAEVSASSPGTNAEDGSEMAIPVSLGKPGQSAIILYLRSPLPRAFGPRQIRWITELTRSGAHALGASSPAESELSSSMDAPVAFLLQSTPSWWPLTKHLRAGEVVDWKVNRLRSLMTPGALVLFWSAQDGHQTSPRGLWGWGLVVPASRASARSTSRVAVLCIERWSVSNALESAPLRARKILSLPSWQTHLLNRNATGASFAVDAHQLADVVSVLQEHAPQSQLVQAAATIARGEKLEVGHFRATTLSWLERAHGSMGWLVMADVVGYNGVIRQQGRTAAQRDLQTWINDLRVIIERGGGKTLRVVNDALFAVIAERNASPADALTIFRHLTDYQAQSHLPFRFAVHFGQAAFYPEEFAKSRDAIFLARSEKLAKNAKAPAILSQAAVDSLGLQGQCDVVAKATLEGVQREFYALPRAGRGLGEASAPAPG